MQTDPVEIVVRDELAQSGQLFSPEFSNRSISAGSDTPRSRST
jgi:hypothetical protein